SLVRILKLDIPGRKIYVSGLDMCDGTPVLDIKPWNPADCPTCLHEIVEHGRPVDNVCQQQKRGHWAPVNFGGAGTSTTATESNDPCIDRDLWRTKVPGWVAAGIQDPYELDVRYEPAALNNLRKIVQAGKLLFYGHDEEELLIGALRRILSLDIRSFHQGRGKKGFSLTPADMVKDIGGYANGGPGGVVVPAVAAIAAGRNAKEGSDVGSSSSSSTGAGAVGEEEAAGGESDIGQKYELDYDVLNIKFTVKLDEDGEPWVSVDVVAVRPG
ncbi:hypothetical protein HDU76_007986, partial [Blyttiomyces sp. JEL0837]